MSKITYSTSGTDDGSIYWGSAKSEINTDMYSIFENDDLAREVWMQKYEPSSPQTTPKSPEAIIDMYVDSIMKMENQYENGLSKEEVKKLLNGFKHFMLGGSIMYGLSNPKKPVSLSNCWVIGEKNPKDSYGTIMRYDEETVQLSKRRGGVGLDLGFIRPSGSYINNAAITSTGVVAFAKRFSNSIMEVGQGGRRGALMLTLPMSHPDVMDFIKAKANTSDLQGANISLKISDAFMRDIIDIKYKPPSLDGANPARFMPNNYEPSSQFEALVKNARDFSEPGIQFSSRINEQIDSTFYNNAGYKPVSMNPCGELALSPYESCRLGSMILYSFVNNPFTESAEFDYDKFEHYVYIAQKVMDSIIDLEIKKITSILTLLKKETLVRKRGVTENNLSAEMNLWKLAIEKAKGGRRTGLGYMGLADAFAAMNYKYGSKESIDFTESISKSFMKASYKASIDMAEMKGYFPAYSHIEFDNSVDNKQINIIKSILPQEYLDKWKLYGRRNIQNLALAPTGSISIIARVSSSLEPVFNIKYSRRKRYQRSYTSFDKPFPENVIVDDNGNSWTEHKVVHPRFKDWYKVIHKKDFDLSKYNDKEFEKLFKSSPYYGSTAHEIDPISKLEIQASIQKYIDGGISNTLNLPEDVKYEDVEQYFLYAWEIGLKGITIYRDNSRSGILLKDKKKSFTHHDATQRPRSVIAKVHNIQIKKDNWVVIVGVIDKNPYEIFAYKAKPLTIADDNPLSSLTLIKNKGRDYSLLYYNFSEKGGSSKTIVKNIISKFESEKEEVITRLLSISLRHGVDIKFIHEQLMKAPGDITDFHTAITRVLGMYIDDATSEVCPDCSNKLTYEGGCLICKACGYSKC